MNNRLQQQQNTPDLTVNATKAGQQTSVQGIGLQGQGDNGRQLSNTKIKGSIAGTHYDPESALANRGKQRRPAPVHKTISTSNQGATGTKLGGQPTQLKKRQAFGDKGQNQQNARGARSQSK